MNGNYIIITESMLQLGLKPIEVMLLAKIKSYKNGCFASIENISKEFSVGYSTIQRALKTLLNKGLIIADKKTKYNTIKYTVVETLTDETPIDNNQDNKQDNKQDEQKEEKTVNTAAKEEKEENEQNMNDNNNVNCNYNRGRAESYTSWLYGDDENYY